MHGAGRVALQYPTGQQAVLIARLRISVSNEREAVHSILAVIVHWGYHKRIALSESQSAVSVDQGDLDHSTASLAQSC